MSTDTPPTIPTTCPLMSCERVERLAVTVADHGQRLSLLEQREAEWRRLVAENTKALRDVLTVLHEREEPSSERRPRRVRGRKKG